MSDELVSMMLLAVEMTLMVVKVTQIRAMMREHTASTMVNYVVEMTTVSVKRIKMIDWRTRMILKMTIALLSIAAAQEERNQERSQKLHFLN